MSFNERFFSGYTMIPNVLIQMRQQKVITRNEFEVLHIIFAFKNFKHHHTSSVQIAELIGGITRQTVMGVLKSLEEKKMIRSTKVDYHFTQYELLLQEKVTIEKTDISQFTFKSGSKKVGALEDIPEEENEEVCAPENRYMCSREQIVCAPENTIELRLELNKTNNTYDEQKTLKTKNPSKIKKPKTDLTTQIKDYWNTKTPNTNIPKLISIKGKRKDRVLSLTQDMFKTIDEWYNYIDKIFTSNFLRGYTKDWHATFDWILKEDNITKILEGNYHKDQQQALPLSAQQIFDAIDSIPYPEDLKPNTNGPGDFMHNRGAL